MRDFQMEKRTASSCSHVLLYIQHLSLMCNKLRLLKQMLIRKELDRDADLGLPYSFPKTDPDPENKSDFYKDLEKLRLGENETEQPVTLTKMKKPKKDCKRRPPVLLDKDLLDELHKLQKQRSCFHQVKYVSTLLEVLTGTISELEEKGSFSRLTDFLASERRSLNKDAILRKSICSKKARMKELDKEIAEFEKQSKLTVQRQRCLLYNLKDELHLAKQKRDSDIEFINVWMTARNEHEAGVVHKNEILDKRAAIAHQRNQIDCDITAYENLAAWTKLVSAQMSRKIEEWKEKTEVDVREIEKQIEEKKKFLEEEEERVNAIRIHIGERMAELAPWEEEKEQEKQERLEHMRRFYSSRKIQRWWRKHMIQHGLYKKKKPKVKGKRGSKGST